MDTGQDSEYFINVIKIVLVAWSVLGFIFVPKMFYLRLSKKAKSSKISEEERKNLAIKNRRARGVGGGSRTSFASEGGTEGAKFVIETTYGQRRSDIKPGATTMTTPDPLAGDTDSFSKRESEVKFAESPAVNSKPDESETSTGDVSNDIADESGDDDGEALKADMSFGDGDCLV